MAFLPEINGFVQALVDCCGAGTTFVGSNFLFRMVLGIEFLAICVWYFGYFPDGCGVVANGSLEYCRVPPSVRSMWPLHLSMVWGLVFCYPVFFVSRFGAGVCAVFLFFSASSLFGQSRLVMAFLCPQLTL